jgi:hypothetical protein
MDLIKIKPEIVDATVWLLASSITVTLLKPTSALGGMDNFTLVTVPHYYVKKVVFLNKTVNITGTKLDRVEFKPEVITLETVKDRFLSSKIFTDHISSDDDDAAAYGDKMRKYFARYIGALSTIESATLASTNTQGEGVDTSVFSQEEKEARVRLSKADSRIEKMFKELAEKYEAISEYSPAYLMDNIPDQVISYINKN